MDVRHLLDTRDGDGLRRFAPGGPVGRGDPLDGVQRIGGRGRRRRERSGGQRTQDEGPRGQHRIPRGVPAHQREGVGPGRLQTHPQAARPGGVQPQPRPGERQPPLVRRRVRVPHRQQMQGRVQQRRVDRELRLLVPWFTGKDDLGQQGVTEPPGGPQVAERRAVSVSQGGETVVHLADVGGHGTGTGPGVVRSGVHGRVVGGERAGGVPHPGRVGVGPGVYGERPAAVRLRGRHRELHGQGSLGREGQRCLQGQLVHHEGPRAFTGAQRQVGEEARRCQGRAVHRVVGQPGPSSTPAADGRASSRIQ